MKNRYLVIITLFLLFIIPSCEKDLPYPIDEVKRGVLIDIVRVAGTDGVLSNGSTAGNYKVKLSIPENQGDYSFLKNAQLLAVLQNINGTYTSQVVVDNITEFPKEIQIDVADVYSKLGLTTPAVGQILYFTTNAVLADNSIIPGWTEVAGFNNIAFSGWLVEGRAYSSNVRYSVVCPLILDDFAGTCTVTLDEWWGETPYPVEVTKISDTELKISGLCNGVCSNDLIITVDPIDYSISIPKQVLEPESGYWWSDSGRPAYNNFSLQGAGTINACELSISFSATATVDAGSFGTVSFELHK
ncbi:MAG: hypothetical protein LBC48_01160 [Dysgonamonadaceae bacterium]|jgi:hypothetical protein|nr:hypothetical protein [Dysgonamonadaceae bacterium]